MSTTFKEFAKLFIPATVTVLIAATGLTYLRNQNLLELVKLRQQALVTQETKVVEQGLADHIASVRFLAQLSGHMSSTAFSPKAITETYIDFARTHPQYFSIRFIGTDGMEQIRINNSYSGPVAKAGKGLQSKKNRYYFKEAIKGGPNDVYVSSFDLNVEHGKVEIPHRATLRFACPVFNAEGETTGIAVLNLDGNPFLHNIKAQIEGMEGRLLLTNTDGYWVIGPRPEEEWVHILQQHSSPPAKQTFPSVWPFISQNRKGQILDAEGLFTFSTISITQGGTKLSATLDTNQFGPRWKIISWVTPEELDITSSTTISITILLILLQSIACWYVATSRSGQHAVEIELRESQEQMAAISQSAQDAIAMIDDQDHITYWNPAAERLFGYFYEEVKGKKLHDILAPSSLHELAHAGIERFAATGEGSAVGEVMEFDAIRKDGMPIPVELAVSSFQLKNRWYAVGSMRDVTRRRRYELALKQSEETSRALLNAPSESAILTETNGVIIAINAIGARRFNGTPKSMIGHNIYDLLPSEIASLRREWIQKVIQDGEPITMEDNRNGRQMLSNIYPVKDPNGQVDKIAIFARDVTDQRSAQAALKLSEQRFRDVSEAVGEFIWEQNEKGAYTFVTTDVENVLGYSPAELLGRSCDFLLTEESLKEYVQWRREITVEQLPFSNKEVRMVTKQGEIIWVQINGVPYYDEDESFLGYRGAAMNITDRREAEDAVKASEQKLRALAESAYDAIIMIDTNATISFWNRAAEQLFGYTEEEAIGEQVHALISPPELRDKADNGMYGFALTGTGPAVGKVQETEGIHKDGRRIPVERSVTGFKLGDDWYAVATIRDITERKATEERLRELATTDSLTSLYNRRHFMEVAMREHARSLRYNGPLAFFMIDIDHFKNINDTHGHDVGDEVLRSLAETTILALRNADIVGRLGGEEFGVLLPETQQTSAMEVAERLRLSIERKIIATNAGEIHITISIGVATMPPETRTIQALLKRADIALYEAKQSGRNKVVAG